MIGKCFSEVQFDDAMGVVGLIMRTRNDELRDTSRDTLGCRSDAAMMHDGFAAREEVLEASVRDVQDIV